MPEALPEGGVIDPALVRFSQASIRDTFQNGRTIADLARGLRDGSVAPRDVPPIRVVERGGKLFTLDNRRLWAFREAGVDIPYREATDEEGRTEAWKFTTKNDGLSVRVKPGR